MVQIVSKPKSRYLNIRVDEDIDKSLKRQLKRSDEYETVSDVVRDAVLWLERFPLGPDALSRIERHAREAGISPDELIERWIRKMYE